MYMYKEDLALNNLQWLICHKIQPTKSPRLVVFPSIKNFVCPITYLFFSWRWIHAFSMSTLIQSEIPTALSRIWDVSSISYNNNYYNKCISSNSMSFN